MNEKETVSLNITDFPEEVIVEDGISFYGETSYENQVAVMSHYLHNSYHEISDDKKKEIVLAIREFLSRKGYTEGELDDMSDEEVWKVAECPHQNDLFADFFDIPFPSPKHPQHTFIDLFAGIGGIRIPFDELGYQCLFSSEWDAKASQTYFANFGTVPFGDITKIYSGSQSFSRSLNSSSR